MTFFNREKRNDPPHKINFAKGSKDNDARKNLPFTVIFGIFTLLNIRSALIAHSHQYSSWQFCAAGLMLLLCFIRAIYIYYIWFLNVLDAKFFPDLYNISYTEKSHKIIKFIVCLFIIHIILLNLFPLLKEIANNVEVIVWCLKVVACIILFGILWEMLIEKRKEQIVEQLERDVLLYELETNKIRDRFITYLVGHTLSDWLKLSEKELSDIFDLEFAALDKMEKNIMNNSNKAACSADIHQLKTQYRSSVNKYVDKRKCFLDQIKHLMEQRGAFNDGILSAFISENVQRNTGALNALKNKYNNIKALIENRGK